MLRDSMMMLMLAGVSDGQHSTLNIYALILDAYYRRLQGSLFKKDDDDDDDDDNDEMMMMMMMMVVVMVVKDGEEEEEEHEKVMNRVCRW
ncbi:hypothetical protein PoB_003593200 [Plakobranchus ocellatus]|uniref:Uncharacterized protein n=1 Tax=Plakobranchus ocellatus TaxID=259542 RepID=A0AAV4AQ45_9GAST|nr:hypothetical protein PoB_003593200 [Plakobranchus ocellatus]